MVDANIVRLLGTGAQPVADGAGEVGCVLIAAIFLAEEERETVVHCKGVVKLQAPNFLLNHRSVHEVVILKES